MLSPAIKIHTAPSLTPHRTRSRFLSITNATIATATKQRHAPPNSIPYYSTATASLYEILEIPVGATSLEIKMAYRKLARTCHPDVAVSVADRSAAEEFMRIHAAYSTLSDPEKRAVYDRKMLSRRGIRPLTSAVGSVGGGYRGRSWETDQCW